MTGRLVGIGVLCAAIALAQPKGNCVRLGTPLGNPNAGVPISVGIAADQPPGHQPSPDTVVLDVQLPKMYFDAGEPVVLTTHLHTRGGVDMDGGDMAVDDSVVAGPMDHDEQQKGRKHGQAKGNGQHQAALDNSPGEHNLTVWRDAVDAHGNSVHQAVAGFYVVATGEITFLDVGSVHPVGDLLVVELKARSTGGVFVVSATLASGPIAVARAETQVQLSPGKATIELPFAKADIVEAGPYRLVDVMAHGGMGLGMAAAPHDIGEPFQAAHADHEPEPLRNEEGALVGGPYGPAPDLQPPSPPVPDPQPLSVIPTPPAEWGEPYLP